MNTRQPIDTSSSPVSLSANFNQDGSCFSIGLDSGFCVFNSDPCELRVSRDFNAGIGLVEMLGKANYVALVGGGRQPKFAQNKVTIWDDHKAKAVISLEFQTSVLNVQLSKSRIVVVLHNSVNVYSFSTPPKKQTTYETSDNPLGLGRMGDRTLVFPARSPGQIQVVDFQTGLVNLIRAHESPLGALDISPDGNLIATASEKGTLIRVWSAINSTKVAELRRGMNPVAIYALRFSPSSSMLAVTSDKSTLHIFDVPSSTTSQRPTSASSSEESNAKYGVLSKIPFMPRVFSDEYSFASTHFEIGDDQRPRPISGAAYSKNMLNGVPSGRQHKGLVGWIDDATIIIVSAGQDGRWEKFSLKLDKDGKRICYREGWKRYLGGN